LIVISGEVNSSIAYNKENDGTANNNNNRAGIVVQIISISVLCVIFEGIGFLDSVKNQQILPIIQSTNIIITTRKNIIS